MRRFTAFILAAALLLGCAGCERFGGAITPPPSPWTSEKPKDKPTPTPTTSTEPVAPSDQPAQSTAPSTSDEPAVSVEPSDGPVNTTSAAPPSTPSTAPSSTPVSNDTTLDDEVARIIAKVSKESDSVEQKLTAVFDWMVETLKYKYVTVDLSNGYTDALISELATYTITTYRGACEHQAALMKVFADAIGAPAVVVPGEFLAEDGTWTEHGWVIVQLPNGDYRHIDVLFGRNHTGGKPHTMLLKTDEEFSKTHRWDNSAFPACE